MTTDHQPDHDHNQEDWRELARQIQAEKNPQKDDRTRSATHRPVRGATSPKKPAPQSGDAEALRFSGSVVRQEGLDLGPPPRPKPIVNPPLTRHPLVASFSDCWKGPRVRIRARLQPCRKAQ